ncbi:hypothetical protein ACFL14_00685 [Patescibacteria group bacterium]
MICPAWAEWDLSLLKYDIDYQVEILGIEEYENQDFENNPNIETVQAAKDELLVRLTDDQDLEVIFDIAEAYQMELLRRYRVSAPSFRIRFIQDIELDWTLEEVWIALLKDERVYCVSPNVIADLDSEVAGPD